MKRRMDVSRCCCGCNTQVNHTFLSAYHTGRFTLSSGNRRIFTPGLYSGNTHPQQGNFGGSDFSSGQIFSDEYIVCFMTPLHAQNPELVSATPYDLSSPQNAVDACSVVADFFVGFNNRPKRHIFYMPLPNQTVDLIPLDVGLAPITNLSDFDPLVQPETVVQDIGGKSPPNFFEVNSVDITSIVNVWGQRRLDLGITSARPDEFQILVRIDKTDTPFDPSGEFHCMNTGEGTSGQPRMPLIRVKIN